MTAQRLGCPVCLQCSTRLWHPDAGVYIGTLRIDDPDLDACLDIPLDNQTAAGYELWACPDCHAAFDAGE